MKKRFLGLALVVTLAMLLIPMALADECFHSGSRHYEYDEETHWEVCDDCGEIVWGPFTHFAYCDERICVTCDAPYAGDGIEHREVVLEYNEEEHWFVCKNCGEELLETHEAHWAYCDAPNICVLCGGPYTGSDILHGETIIEYDEDGHWNSCKKCGEIISGPNAHSAYCDRPDVCVYCDAPYTGSNIYHWEIEYKYDEDSHWYVCKNCGEEVPESRNAHYAFCYAPDICHVCGAPYTCGDIQHSIDIIEHDEDTHWYACRECGEITAGPFAHYAYCNEPDICAGCGAPYTGTDLEHLNEEIVLGYDEEEHWIACSTCGEILSTPFGHYAWCDKPNVCAECGAPFTGTVQHKSWPGIKEYDENGHWWVCESCGEILQGPEEHRASCIALGVCGECGAPYTGNNIFHDYYGPNTRYVKYDEETHYEICGACGGIIEFPWPHIASCSALGTCMVCDAPYNGDNVYHEEITEHDENTHWDVCEMCGETVLGPEEHYAYCNNPGICGYCGAPYTGSNSLHQFTMEHDEDAHWYACELCGLIEDREVHWAACDYRGYCAVCHVPYEGDEIYHLSSELVYEHDDNQHWIVFCKLCGENIIDSIHEQHRASDADPTVCDVCGAPMPGSGGTTTDPTPGTSGQAPAAVWDDSLGKLTTPDNPTYTGFADFEGGKFYIENGQQKTDFVGPVQVNGTFYAFDQGRLQTENMMMAFEGGLFAFNGGTLRTDLIGLAVYDGEQFVFDHGQYQRSANGPYLDPISGKWVYVNEGQFYPITDLVSYDGEIFYFVDGFLATGFTGIVYDFNGTGFYIASGQHYKITDLVSCNGEVLYVVDGKFASWYTGMVKDFKGAELNVVNGKVVQ